MRKKSVILILATVFSVIPNFQYQATAAACTGTSGTDGAFTLMKFTAAQSNCTWQIPSGVNSIGVLIVGGGGGAGFGSLGGGGGGGQVLVSSSNLSVNPNDTVTLTVATGGTRGWAAAQASWNFGGNGETSTVNIAGRNIFAIGGGGGGGNNRATGGSGGSGGGGASGGSAGSAITNNFSGFTSYGNSAVLVSGNGGGGAGAGAANTAGTSTGGAGVTVWGLSIAGGGGGWASGSGATSFGGGSASNGIDSGNHGTAGSDGTGGGGGGGEKGGTGLVVFRYQTSAFSSFALASNATTATYRQAVTITANVSVASKVTFRANNLIIPGCKNKSTSGTSPNIVATCNWRPSLRGKVVITATAVPTTAGISTASASPVSVVVSNRSGTR